MTIGDRIRKKREEAEISQTDLAKAIDVSKQTLYKYENNIITNIPSDKIEKISKILNISPTYIMGWDENYYLSENLQNIFELLSIEFSIPTNELIRHFFAEDFSDLLPSQKVITLDNMRNALKKHLTLFSRENISLSSDEQDHIQKYRDLDPHGKEMVDFTLLKEWERSIADRKQESTAVPQDDVHNPNIRLINYYYRLASAGTGQIVFDLPPTKKIEIPDIAKYKKVDYAIGVNGNSMEPVYHDGDTLLIEMAEEIEPGEIGIFLVDNESYVKKLGDGELISLNPKSDNIPLTENARCMGRVIDKL